MHIYLILFQLLDLNKKMNIFNLLKDKVFLLSNKQRVANFCIPKRFKGTAAVKTEIKFYYPDDILHEGNIHFVGTPAKFANMLKYFESTKPKVIGLDSESR